MADVPVVLSKHAHEKMQARHVTFDEVLECIRDAQVSYGSDAERIYQRRTLAVVVATNYDELGLIDSLTVVTVLLRHLNQWDDEQARSRTRS